MLKIAEKISQLDFRQLMEVYAQSNEENGRENYPDCSQGEQLILAEGDFYQYLRECFFSAPNAVYALWSHSGHYVSALRLEPYQDGFLLEGLETVPEERGRGYGAALIRGVQETGKWGKIYSHVRKGNEASLAVHKACGFRKVLDHAVYADGSVLYDNVTLLWEK